MMRNRPGPGGGLLGDGPRMGAMPAAPAFQGGRGNPGLLGQAPPVVRTPQSNQQRGLLGTPPASQAYQPQGRPAGRSGMGAQLPQRPYVPPPQAREVVEDQGYFGEQLVEEAYVEQEGMYEDPYVEPAQYAEGEGYLEEEYVEPYQEHAQADVEEYYEEEADRADLMEYAAGQIAEDYHNEQLIEEEQYVEEGYGVEYEQQHVVHEQPLHHPARGVDRGLLDGPIREQVRGPDRGLLEDPMRQRARGGLLEDPPMVDYEPYNRQDQKQFGGQRPGARPQNAQYEKQLPHHPPPRPPAHMEQRLPIHPHRDARNDANQRRQGLLESPKAPPPRRGDGLLDPPDMRPLGRELTAGKGLLDPPSMQPPVMPEPLRQSRWSQDNLQQRPRSNERNQARQNERNQTGQNDRNKGRQNQLRQDRPSERNQGRQNERVGRNMGRTAEQEDPRQNDLMSLAEIQMKMLEQEKARSMELEQAERMFQQQQVMMIAQQQLEQQQFLQQQQEQQLLQQQQEAQSIMAMSGTFPGGSIPSIFDVSTGRNQSQLGKRPGADGRRGDNKRLRTQSAENNDRNKTSAMRPRGPAGKQQQLKNSPRDRKNRPSRFSSPTSRDRDRRDSGSNRGKGSSGPRGRSERGERRSRERLSLDSKPKSDSGKKSTERKTANKEGVKSKEGEKKPVVKENKEEYDPANPTGDIPEELIVKKPASLNADKTVITIETSEQTEQADSQVNKDVAQDDGQEISLKVTVNKKGRSVNDKEKTEKRKLIKCNVCNIDCWDEESFARHMNGQKHRQKMTMVMMNTTHQVDLVLSRKQAEEHLRQIEGSKLRSPPAKPAAAEKSIKTQESHCKTCNKKYTGPYTDHKEMPDHKAREMRARAGCKVCNVTSFSTFIDFTKHLESSWHRKKVKKEDWPECKLCKQTFKSPRKFVRHCKTQHHQENKRKQRDEGKDHDDLGDLVTLDIVGFEDDLNDSMRSTESKKSDKKEESSAKTADKTEDKEEVKESSAVRERSDSSKDGDLQIPGEYDPNVACGQTYVVPVIGFFCKLCHKFYNNENAAKVAHCQSRPHFDKFKKIMAAKIAKLKSKPVPVDTKEDAKDNGPIETTEDKPANHISNEEKDVTMPETNGDTAAEVPKQADQVDSNKSVEPANEEESGEVSLDSTQEMDAMEVDTGPSNAADDTLEESDSGGDITIKEEHQEEEEEVVVTKVTVPRARRGGATPRARRGRRGH
ncbi:trichohyalin-like isoform X2 [Dreissena polymorpha]|uniref:trichohyalin-like isoform X2 n=1 Tax=Dreissena polymorpha TaxID=45954 RepID=UPI0022652584|nr:trichohyalin-like isoform X2 [Dreissena polymorpha]